MLESIHLQWGIILLFGLAFFFLAPLSKTTAEFFAALSKKGRQPSVFMLTSSLVISWIFAKSITNAANLGLSFGFVGSIAYAAYYLSFVVAGIVIYQLRTKGNFSSIHHFLEQRFGKSAIRLFSLLIGFRL
ncbi:MAG: sodium:solute symporter, partial [Bacteroidota bacterium]